MKIGSAPPAVFADPQQFGVTPVASVQPASMDDGIADPGIADPNSIDPQQPHPAHPPAAHKVSGASETLETLRAAKRDADIARAHASQKLQDLKAQLHLVEMLHTGDPARHVRAVTQIARELAASVQEFISVGGTPIDLSAINVDPIKDTNPPSTVSPTDPAVLVAAAAVATASRGNVQHAAAAQAATAQREAEAVDLTSAVTKVSTVTSVAVTVGEDPDAAFARDARALARDVKASVRRLHEQDDDGDAAADEVDRLFAPASGIPALTTAI